MNVTKHENNSKYAVCVMKNLNHCVKVAEVLNLSEKKAKYPMVKKDQAKSSWINGLILTYEWLVQ